MSRKLLAFLLSELRIVRIMCKNKQCGAITELPISHLKSYWSNSKCKVCDFDFTPANDPKNPFYLLSEAIDRFKMVEDRLDLEFILDDKTATQTWDSTHRGGKSARGARSFWRWEARQWLFRILGPSKRARKS